ncbi:MAG TPA: response regulator transcription factor, partial [Chroococcidiopsis sp.]
PQELIVRVRALFRRDLNKHSDDKHVIETAHLKIDRERREVWIKSEGRSPTRIRLPVTEFDLLAVLANGKAGRVWERGELLDAVWGEHFIGDSQIVTSYIRRLRSKLTFDTGELLPCIKTHPGIGYSFEDTDI